MNAAKTIHEHKVATILKCMQEGLSPADTAQIFLKQAEIINACCDALVKDFHEKQAAISDYLLSPKIPAGLLAASIGIPIAAGYGAGHVLGDTAAKALTPVNELPVSSYQKAEEILRLKNETADILARVEAKKKRDSEKSNARSVRALF